MCYCLRCSDNLLLFLFCKIVGILSIIVIPDLAAASGSPRPFQNLHMLLSTNSKMSVLLLLQRNVSKYFVHSYPRCKWLSVCAVIQTWNFKICVGSFGSSKYCLFGHISRKYRRKIDPNNEIKKSNSWTFNALVIR